MAAAFAWCAVFASAAVFYMRSGDWANLRQRVPAAGNRDWSFVGERRWMPWLEPWWRQDGTGCRAADQPIETDAGHALDANEQPERWLGFGALIPTIPAGFDSKHGCKLSGGEARTPIGLTVGDAQQLQAGSEAIPERRCRRSCWRRRSERGWRPAQQYSWPFKVQGCDPPFRVAAFAWVTGLGRVPSLL